MQQNISNKTNQAPSKQHHKQKIVFKLGEKRLKRICKIRVPSKQKQKTKHNPNQSKQKQSARAKMTRLQLWSSFPSLFFAAELIRGIVGQRNLCFVQEAKLELQKTWY